MLSLSTSDETAMTANQAQGIVEYMPTLEERKKLRDYMKTGDGDSASKFDKLCECEKFMVAMMTVKQSKRKLRALLFKLQFRGCIHDLARGKCCIYNALTFPLQSGLLTHMLSFQMYSLSKKLATSFLHLFVYANC